MLYERELRAALDAAERAGTVILEQYARFEAIADAPASITTAADRESQEVILRHLSAAFPGDAFRPKAVAETYSAGIKLARVARGEADLYVSTYAVMNDWDLAAGHALVAEAGGRVSDLGGRPLRYGDGGPEHHGGLLASNGLLHEP